jgi:hypothetical protein
MTKPEDACDCCKVCCCCNTCDCDGCGGDVPQATAKRRARWKDWLPFAIPVLLVSGCVAVTYQSSDFTIVAKVESKILQDASSNPLEASGEKERTIKVRVVTPNRVDDFADIWFHRVVSQEHYDRLEEDKWYKMRIRYYPYPRLFVGSHDYEILEIVEGPIEAPVPMGQ